MKQTSFILDFRYKPPLLLGIIADYQQQQANEWAKTLQHHEFIEQLRCIFAVASHEPHYAQDNYMADATMSQCLIDPAITAVMKILLSSNDLPITYTNMNLTQCKLEHGYIWPYWILQIHRNAIQLDIPNDMKVYDAGNISRSIAECTDDVMVAWQQPPPLIWTHPGQSNYDVQSIKSHQSSSDGIH